MSTTLQAFFDSSGATHDSPIITLAGYISTPNEWGRFDGAWNDVLLAWGIPYLHMKDLNARKKGSPFQGWTETQSEQLRADLFNTCFGNKWGRPEQDFIGVACSVNVSDYRQAQMLCPKLREKPAEAFCVDHVVDPALRMLPQDLRSPVTGKRGQLELYFDQGEPFLRQVNAAWQRYRKDRDTPFSLISDIQSADMRDRPGIQAADCAAWLANKDLRDHDSYSNVFRHFMAPGFREYFNLEKLVARYGAS